MKKHNTLWGTLIILCLFIGCQQDDSRPENQLSKPVKISPIEGEIVDYQSVTFRWELPNSEDLQENVTYDFSIGKGLLGWYFSENQIVGTEYTIESLDPNSTYIWTLQAEFETDTVFSDPLFSVMKTSHKVFEDLIVIKNQEELDMFGEQGYTKVKGGIVLSGSVESEYLNTKERLNELAIIEGSMGIAQPTLINLEGLIGLDSITGVGNLVIGRPKRDPQAPVNLPDYYDNKELTSLKGLDSLKYVAGDLIIRENDVLTDYCALIKLIEGEGVKGEIVIEGNSYNPTIQEIINGGCKQ